MPPPLDADRTLGILVLRTLRMSQEAVADTVRCNKSKIKEVENWFRDLDRRDAVTFADAEAIRRLSQREFGSYRLDDATLKRAGQITGDDLMRYLRADYLSKPSDSEHLEQLASSRLVVEVAAYRHVSRVSEVAKQLEAQVQLPPLSEAGSWIPPQGSSHSVRCIWTGVVQGIQGHTFNWEPTIDGPGQMRFAVEADDYFPCLKNHVPNRGVWDRIEKWKSMGAECLLGCRRFVETIVTRSEKSTGVTGLLTDREWSQSGVFWYFAECVYSHHTQLAQWPQGMGLARHRYEFGTAPSRIPKQGPVHTLSHGGRGIACHRNKSVLERWGRRYRGLLKNKELAEVADELAIKYGSLEKEAKAIKAVLREEIERGTFERGRCSLCP